MLRKIIIKHYLDKYYKGYFHQWANELEEYEIDEDSLGNVVKTVALVEYADTGEIALWPCELIRFVENFNQPELRGNEAKEINF